ncbi:MAG: MGMT family protein [Desulfurococcaceae archaeon]
MLVVEKKGNNVEFRTSSLEDICMAVYTLIMLIPPGFVTSYGSIARVLGIHPRKVAFCLKKNTELIVIPCHRVVYNTGKLGGYSELGALFKKKLLELEGVIFEDDNRVSRDCIIDLGDLLNKSDQ